MKRDGDWVAWVLQFIAGLTAWLRNKPRSYP